MIVLNRWCEKADFFRCGNQTEQKNKIKENRLQSISLNYAQFFPFTLQLNAKQLRATLTTIPLPCNMFRWYLCVIRKIFEKFNKFCTFFFLTLFILMTQIKRVKNWFYFGSYKLNLWVNELERGQNSLERWILKSIRWKHTKNIPSNQSFW